MTIDPIYSARDYLAPTVYKLAGHGIPSGFNYYSTLQQAQAKYLYLAGKGGYNATPAGAVVFPSTEATTMGINVDFYALANGSWQLRSYKDIRNSISSSTPIVYRFFRTDGSGPYYAILDRSLFGIAATTISSVSAEKLAALDAYYREVALLKYRYNNLVGFLNSLAQRQLNSQEQQIFNEGVLRLQQMQQELSTIHGIEITYTATGAVIGFVPILIIAIVAILAAVTGWTIVEIMEMKEKTQQINDAYNLTQWVATKKQEIAAQVNAGVITPAQAQEINSTLDGATQLANQVAANASKNTGGGLFSNIEGIVKWGAIGFIAVKGLDLLKSRRSSQ